MIFAEKGGRGPECRDGAAGPLTQGLIHLGASSPVTPLSDQRLLHCTRTVVTLYWRCSKIVSKTPGHCISGVVVIYYLGRRQSGGGRK